MSAVMYKAFYMYNHEKIAAVLGNQWEKDIKVSIDILVTQVVSTSPTSLHRNWCSSSRMCIITTAVSFILKSNFYLRPRKYSRMHQDLS